MNQRIAAFCQFLNNSHSLYHVTANVRRLLEAEGYRCLEEGLPWELVSGGKYYLCRGGSSVIAFRIPGCTPHGFMISTSHCDHPAFKLKENGELTGTYTRLATEKYGGMMIAPWLDRPLGIAGRVLVETPEGVRQVLVDPDKDLALIPNLAIHMNRTVNDNCGWNPAVDTLALLGGRDAGGKLMALLEQEAGGKILGHDLYLYVRQKASVWGPEEEYISAQGLDDLQCLWGCTQGFVNSGEGQSIPVLAILDSEEVGSSSPQGADSTLLSGTLERISRCLGLEHCRMLAGSMAVSADNVHAIHPNHPEYADPANAPELNRGVCIKFNASQRYTTDGLSAALFRKICAAAGVPLQTYYNRADLKGGATLGYISLNHVSIPSVDVGLPQLAMHSCWETAGTQDVLHMENAMAAFCQTSLQCRNGEYTLT